MRDPRQSVLPPTLLRILHSANLSQLLLFCRMMQRLYAPSINPFSRQGNIAFAPRMLREVWAAMRRLEGSAADSHPALRMNESDLVSLVLHKGSDKLPDPEDIIPALDVAVEWCIERLESGPGRQGQPLGVVQPNDFPETTRSIVDENLRQQAREMYGAAKEVNRIVNSWEEWLFGGDAGFGADFPDRPTSETDPVVIDAFDFANANHVAVREAVGKLHAYGVLSPLPQSQPVEETLRLFPRSQDALDQIAEVVDEDDLPVEEYDTDPFRALYFCVMYALPEMLALQREMQDLLQKLESAPLAVLWSLTQQDGGGEGMDTGKTSDSSTSQLESGSLAEFLRKNDRRAVEFKEATGREMPLDRQEWMTLAAEYNFPGYGQRPFSEDEAYAWVVGIAKRRANEGTREIPLNDSQEEILIMMLKLGAISADGRQKQEVIVKHINKKASVENYKRPFSALTRFKLTESRGAQDGGMWLTAEGIRRAQRLNAPTDYQ